MRYKTGALPAELTTADLQRELSRIQASLDILFDGRLEVHHSVPVRPREGMVVFADGTDWNPGGGGIGVYAYHGAAWNKL